MARRDTRPDPKEAALAAARCLNPHPEQVTDPEDSDRHPALLPV